MDNLQIAMCMAQWSNLTYEDAIKERALDVGIPHLRLIKPDDPDVPILALVGVVNNWVVVAFRGTIFANFGDDLDKWKLMILGMVCNIGGAFIDDRNLSNAARETFGGKAHLGFTALFDKIWGKVKKEVHSQLPGRELYLTGHSLGGALATLAAYQFQEASIPVMGVFTFGSPRVFDKDAARKYSVPHFRFEQKNDIVPLVPPSTELRGQLNEFLEEITEGKVRLPSVDYKHVGRLQYINENNELEENSWFLYMKRGFNLLRNIDRLIKDHAMHNYLRALGHLTVLGDRTQLLTVRIASVADLDTILDQGDLPQKNSAVQELARRGFGSPSTYRILRQIAALNPSGQSEEGRWQLDTLRQHALVALGCLYAMQFPEMPTEQIMTLPLITQIIRSPQEAIAVKAAAIWSVAMLNRRHDQVVYSILTEAGQQSDSHLQQVADDAIMGKITPPFQPGNWTWLAPYRMASISDLASLFPKPGQLSQVVIADEIGFRGFTNLHTFVSMLNAITYDPTQCPLQHRTFTDTLRRSILWAVGQINQTQNWLYPSNRLAGLREIELVLRRTSEHEMVKLAAVESLWILDRSTDNRIRSLLRIASRDEFTSVKEEAKLALSGRLCPAPFPSSQRVWQ